MDELALLNFFAACFDAFNVQKKDEPYTFSYDALEMDKPIHYGIRFLYGCKSPYYGYNNDLNAKSVYVNGDNYISAIPYDKLSINGVYEKDIFKKNNSIVMLVEYTDDNIYEDRHDIIYKNSINNLNMNVIKAFPDIVEALKRNIKESHEIQLKAFNIKDYYKPKDYNDMKNYFDKIIRSLNKNKVQK